MKPRVAITAGDPAGIGPEVAARAAADPRVLDVCEPVVYGPPAGAAFAPGELSAAAGRAAYDVIVRAVADAQHGVVQAIATAPVNKEAFRLAGLEWSGHTDLLAHLTGSRHVAMMFYSEALRVVLATVHIPLAEVPRALTQASLDATIALTARELPRFGIAGAADRGRRAQPARGRARAVRRRGADGDPPRDRRVPGARHRRVGAVSRRHRLRPRQARRVRRRHRLLSRSGADSGEAGRVSGRR